MYVKKKLNDDVRSSWLKATSASLRKISKYEVLYEVPYFRDYCLYFIENTTNTLWKYLCQDFFLNLHRKALCCPNIRSSEKGKGYRYDIHGLGGYSWIEIYCDTLVSVVYGIEESTKYFSTAFCLEKWRIGKLFVWYRDKQDTWFCPR